MQACTCPSQIAAQASVRGPAKAVPARVAVSASVRQATSVVCRAAAPANQAANQASQAKGRSTNTMPEQARKGQWMACVTSAEWLFNDLQNEAFAEQLRERLRYYKERGWDRDFYILPNPAWLDARFPDLAPRVQRPSVAIVSTDEAWVKFMKLRLDRVALVELGNVSPEEALASSDMKLPDYEGNKSDLSRSVPYGRYKTGWWTSFYPGA